MARPLETHSVLTCVLYPFQNQAAQTLKWGRCGASWDPRPGLGTGQSSTITSTAKRNCRDSHPLPPCRDRCADALTPSQSRRAPRTPAPPRRPTLLEPGPTPGAAGCLTYLLEHPKPSCKQLPHGPDGPPRTQPKEGRVRLRPGTWERSKQI